jgi:hypothetical protein
VFQQAVGGHGLNQTEIKAAYIAKRSGDWNGFQQALGGHGFSKPDMSKIYHMQLSGYA